MPAKKKVAPRTAKKVTPKKAVKKAAPKKTTKRQREARKIVREVHALHTKSLAPHDAVNGDHTPIMLGEIEWRAKDGSTRSTGFAWNVVTCNASNSGCGYKVIVEQFGLAKLIADQAAS